MEENAKTELGEIKIHHNVISSITVEAATQIPGVAGIGSNWRSSLMKLVGRKDNTTISIEFDKDGTATIGVPIVVKHGYNIPEIAAKVQDSVKLAIENATNIDVKNVNVVVQGITKEAAQ